MAGAYIKCTATYQNSQYMQYLLVPMRRSDNYIGCVGATNVTYTYSNTIPVVSSKDKYQVLTTDYNIILPKHTIAIYESEFASSIAREIGNGNKTVYSDLPYLSNLKPADADKPATLVLPPIYYADMNYKMAVKMIVEETDANGDKNNNLV